MKPAARPVSSMATRVTKPPPMWWKAREPVTVVSAISEPTDRSIPPTRITNSWPMASAASGATCTSRFFRLSTVRKNGVSSVSTSANNTRIRGGPA